MAWLAAAALLAIVVVVFAVLSGGRGASGTYRSKRPLTEAEQTLFWRLKEAMPECVVLSQVSFSRFLEPVASSGAVRRALFNRISQKTVDFLLCLPDFTVVAVIELDDSSHTTIRDARRDDVVRKAGVPIVRVNVKDMPSVEYLRELFTR